ncbi:hypothetical protein HJD18_08160 [Thermoleophilia bacterium SCSIO 60948]|nr:hypothetical protein HJD18_08160 [Thermoleophilia bacterium SCSIO 60948]
MNQIQALDARRHKRECADARMAAATRRLEFAFRRLNRLASRLPADHLPNLSGPRWTELETKIDLAFAAEDLDAALGAIDVWRAHAEEALRR